MRKLCHGKAADGGCQYRRQRNVLSHVVDNRQQGQHQPYLRGFKVTAVHISIGRNTVFPQGFQQDIGLAAHRAQQHRNIAVSQRTVSVSFLVLDHIALLHEPSDTPGNIGSFQIKAGQVSTFIIFHGRAVIFLLLTGD